MRNDLPHLASLVFDTPLLMSRAKADTILGAIGPRILEGFEAPAPRNDARPTMGVGSSGPAFRYGGHMAGNGIAVLPVIGSLVRRGSWLDAESGLTSYARLTNAIDAMCEDGSVRGIILEMDSHGGEAAGCFDLAAHIRDAATAAGKPVWAHVNELALSAGYAIASAADSIWIPRTGQAGSIGVIAAHLDVSGADEMAGLNWTYIIAGEEKADGNPHEPLSDRALATIQGDVDELYEMFVGMVAEHRGMSADAVRETRAREFRGQGAIEAGLVDQFGTFEEMQIAFAQHIDETTIRGLNPTKKATKHAESHEMTKSAKISAAQPDDKTQTDNVAAPAPDSDSVNDSGPGAVAQPAPTAPVAPPAASQDSHANAERERCAGLCAVAEQASRLGVEFNAQKAISDGLSVDAARASVLDAAATADQAETVTAARPGTTATTDKKAEAKAAWSKGMKRK